MTETTNRWQQAQAVEREAGRRLKRIMRMENEGAQRALLAKLRKGVDRRPGELPELWAILLDDLPENMRSVRTEEPSRAEWAIHTALTMFALHQQGRDVTREPMHQAEISLGAAADHLARCQPGDLAENRERVLRRFNQVATASSMEAINHYLRAFIQLLHANNIALDYAMLARDLFRYQFDDLAKAVRLRWGEDFYATANKEDASDASTENVH